MTRAALVPVWEPFYAPELKVRQAMYEYAIKDARLGHIALACNEMAGDGWDLFQAIPRAGHHQGETEDFVLIFRRPRPA